MLLRVKPGTLPLPHTISSGGIVYQLAPEAELPNEYAAAMLRTHPQHFEEGGKSPIDMTKYTFRESFKNQSIADVVAKMGDEDKLKVMNFAKAVLDGDIGDEVEGPGPAGPSAEQQETLDAYDLLPDDQKKLFLEGKLVLSEDETALVTAFRSMDNGDKAKTLAYVAKKA